MPEVKLVFPLRKVFNLRGVCLTSSYFVNDLTGLYVSFVSHSVPEYVLEPFFNGCSYSFGELSDFMPLTHNNLLPTDNVYPFSKAIYHRMQIVIQNNNTVFLERLQDDIDIHVIVSYVEKQQDTQLVNVIEEKPWFNDSVLRFLNGMVGCSSNMCNSVYKSREFDGKEYTTNNHKAFHITGNNVSINDGLMCLVKGKYDIVSFDYKTKFNSNSWILEDDYYTFRHIVTRYADTVSDLKFVFPSLIIGPVTVTWNKNNEPMDITVVNNEIYINTFTRDNQYNLVGSAMEESYFTVRIHRSNDIKRIIYDGYLTMIYYLYDTELRKQLAKFSNCINY